MHTNDNGEKRTTNGMITCWKNDINWNIDPLSAGHTNLFIQVKLRSSHKCSKDALEVDKKWQEKVKM